MSLGCPQRHPGAPTKTQRHTGGRRETRGIFEVKCVKTIKFYKKNEVSDNFRVDGSDVTLTKSAAGRQQWAGVEEAIVRQRKP